MWGSAGRWSGRHREPPQQGSPTGIASTEAHLYGTTPAGVRSHSRSELYSVPVDLVSEIMHVVTLSLAESSLAHVADVAVRPDALDPTPVLAPDPARRTLALPEAAPPCVVQQDPAA